MGWRDEELFNNARRERDETSPFPFPFPPSHFSFMAMAKFIFIFSLIALSQMFSGGESRNITITNNCSYEVWPASSSSYNAPRFSLLNQQSILIDFQSPQQSFQLWGRTDCTNSTDGKFVCMTGDCGSGNVNCSGSQLPPATTLIEFSLNGANDDDFYDVSLVRGFNLPLAVIPRGGDGSGCAVTGCIYNVTGCPQELQIGSTCQSPCDAFNNSKFCCDSTQQKCQATVYSTLFKQDCPRSYSYALDDGTSTFTCGGSPAYTITFCPSSTTLTSELSKPFQSGASTLSPSPQSPEDFPPSMSLSPQPSIYPARTKKVRIPVYVVVLIPSTIGVLILLFSGIRIYVKKRRAMDRDYGEMEEMSSVESLQFDINTIIAATNNFCVDNKLGEGGFGEVYKGKLESGQEVAVKRLLESSKQGVAEFKTEVVLVAKLQHKNLVKLLGFCATSKEKILVYEFLPNSSLDRFLFDPTSNSFLDWRTRMNIIIGIARGLMYLHEDSRLTVIHRDLKTSNILLDKAMTPKISDFGLAKLFKEDQTQGDTRRIVGTYGYMAPEYAITGHYSVKSDVYSFGVIVLEIISGQKSRFYGGSEVEEALLHRAWRLWNEGKPLDLIDTKLNEDFANEEVIRCFHIGLLCIQEDPNQRPGMRLILDALSRPSINLSNPKSPRFFGSPSDSNDDHLSLLNAYTGTKMITDVYSRD